MTGEPNPTAPALSPAAPPAGPPRCRRWGPVLSLAAFAVGAVWLLQYQAGRPPRLNGDGWEYWFMAASFDRHGTPELRPEDRAEVETEAARVSGGEPVIAEKPPPRPHAYETAPDGRMYGVHFWLYGATAVPAKEYLRLTGRSELGDLGLANAMWFVIAIGVVLFASKAPVGERLALAALAAVGPAIWYIDWTGAELFSWAFALMAVSAYLDRRYVWVGLAAGVAATQNPPLILLGGVSVLAAAWERRWRAAVGAALGTAVGLVPYAFFMYHFGKPNLIAADFARVAYISWVRTWGQVADFDQGLLPYVPLLVFGAAFGAARLVYTRDVRGVLLVAGSVAVAVGTQVSRNWNSACDGLQRYLVWVLPLAAGVAVLGIGGRRRLWVFAAVATAAHVLVLYLHQRNESLQGGYLDHTTLGNWVLTNHPRLYWIEPEVFVERTAQDDDWPMTPADLPLAFLRPDGTVSKMLLEPGDVEKVPVRFVVDPGYMAELRRQAAGETGLFYAHPPHGAVRADLPLAYLRADGTVVKLVLDPASAARVPERFEGSPIFMEAVRLRAAHETGLFRIHPGAGSVRVKRRAP